MTPTETRFPGDNTALTNSEGGAVSNNRSPGIDLVSAALVEAQGQVKAAEFDATNPFFKSKYATLGAIIEASREALHKSGLAILQKPRIVGNLVSVETTIVHKSGQFLDGGCMSLDLEPNDRNSHAQLAGSLITYLKRYAWASVLGIYADVDDDGNNAPKGAVKPPAAKPPAATPAAAPVATSATRSWAIQKLKADVPGAPRTCLHDYMVALKWIGMADTVEMWPLDKVPTNGAELQKLLLRLGEFEAEQRAKEP